MYWYVCLFPISHCSQLPRTWWLKTMQMYNLTVCSYENSIYFLLSNTGQTQVSVGSNQGISRTVFLLGVLGRIHFPAFPASESWLHPWLRILVIFKLAQLWLISQTSPWHSTTLLSHCHLVFSLTLVPPLIRASLITVSPPGYSSIISLSQDP